MIIKEYNGWKIWSKGVRPSSCAEDEEVEFTYHVCNGGTEHFNFKELQEAYDKLAQLGGSNQFILGKTNFI